VLNGNGIPGSGGEATYLLGQRGYRMVEPASGATGNAPTFDYFHTAIFFDPKRKGSEAAARQLAKLFGAADTVAFARPSKCVGPALEQPKSCLVRPLAADAMLTVVTGQTFHNSLPPAPARTTLKREPPYVRTDRAATVGLVRAQQKKVSFPLMVPSVLERASSPDSDVPVRTYRVADEHGAMRLVFRRGLEYWGVQETNWEDAPVLASRNFHRAINGRGYDLYYRGEKLHMIVLRKNGASYWVVNTLLDSLSNETMIAIAKGLQPLNPPKKAKAEAKAKAKAGTQKGKG
jgi:hypothetical protein